LKKIYFKYSFFCFLTVGSIDKIFSKKKQKKILNNYVVAVVDFTNFFTVVVVAIEIFFFFLIFMATNFCLQCVFCFDHQKILHFSFFIF